MQHDLNALIESGELILKLSEGLHLKPGDAIRYSVVPGEYEAEEGADGSIEVKVQVVIELPQRLAGLHDARFVSKDQAPTPDPTFATGILGIASVGLA